MQEFVVVLLLFYQFHLVGLLHSSFILRQLPQILMIRHLALMFFLIKSQYQTLSSQSSVFNFIIYYSNCRIKLHYLK